MRAQHAVVIGAGIGGLTAAISLAREGYRVTVCERAAHAGGKMRETEVDGVRIDAGPTVLTMRWVFDALFEATGAKLEDYVALQKLDVLARHAWSGGAQLDLLTDKAATADAIGDFAGASDARGYLAFCAEAQRMYEILRRPFLMAPKPTPITLTHRVGLTRLGDLLAIRPFDTMWHALCAHFRDPRLRQLFGRYATYCGSSPFDAPATLMLIAHVEREGVWIVKGGMQRFAEALATYAERLGVVFRFNAYVSHIETRAGSVTGLRLQSGERISATAIVCNADPAALTEGLFGQPASRALGPANPAQRTLSAITWAAQGTTSGIALKRHNVFFSDDYRAEFDALLKRRASPSDPTIYICAQDRDDRDGTLDAERLLILANAQPHGDTHPLTQAELDQCEANMLTRLRRCGLKLSASAITRTTPTDFNTLFPATGGALYGRATRGWAASFQRPGARTRIPGLYLAGGGVHPGAGVPMAALSGQLAARSILADHASMKPYRPAATPGGTSTRSATTSSTV